MHPGKELDSFLDPWKGTQDPSQPHTWGWLGAKPPLGGALPPPLGALLPLEITALFIKGITWGG